MAKTLEPKGRKTGLWVAKYHSVIVSLLVDSRHLNECTFSYGTWKPCIAPFFKGRQLVKDADSRAGWGSWKKRKLCRNSKDTGRVPGTKVSLRPTGLLLQENLENCFYEEKQMTVMVKSLTGASSAWDTTPWRSVHKQVKQLQMRIAKAVREKPWVR